MQTDGMHQLPRALVERQQIGGPVSGVASPRWHCNDKATPAMDIAQHSSPTPPAAVAQMTPRVPSASLGLVGKGTDEVEKPHGSVGPSDYCRDRAARTVDTTAAPCSGSRNRRDTNCGAPRRQGHLLMASVVDALPLR